MYTAKDHTFVLCAYKENPFLENAVQSLLSQKVHGDLLISTSTPNDYIQSIADAYGISVIVNSEPRFLGDDWNYGYNHAQTPLVTVAHQDDQYDPDYLKMILEELNQYDGEDVSIVFTDYYELREGERVYKNLLLFIKRLMNAPFLFRALNGSAFVKKRVLSFGDPICCPSITYVKDFLGESIFDTDFRNSCDYKALVDFARAKGRFVYIPEPLMGHRIYAESATTANLAESIRKKEDIGILETLWPRPIAKAINAVYALSEKSNEL